jgi:hypothetical protein
MRFMARVLQASGGLVPLYLDAGSVRGAQHQVGRADADVQRPGKSPPPHDAHVLADAKTQGGQAAMKFRAGVQGEDGCRVSGVQGVESVRVGRFHQRYQVMEAI